MTVARTEARRRRGPRAVGPVTGFALESGRDYIMPEDVEAAIKEQPDRERLLEVRGEVLLLISGGQPCWQVFNRQECARIAARDLP